MSYLRNFCFISILIWTALVKAQLAPNSTLSLESAYGMAQKNYPLIKDIGLIDNIEQLNLEVIRKRGLPKVSLNGTAQAQTENIVLPIGTNPLEAPLETWNAYLGVDYDVYDGGLKKAQKAIEMASAQVERTSIKVQQRSLKDRVNILFFAIELARQQVKILETSKDDLNINIASLQAGLENGTVLESEVSKLKVRQLELISDSIGIEADIEVYFKLLEQLTGTTLPRDVKFLLPLHGIQEVEEINRPEQELFDNQKVLFGAQEASITAKTLPKISLFAQGGVGNPNPLNFSDFNTATYALGGVRLKWDFIDFGKGKKERESLRLRQEQVEVDRELFLFDIESESEEYQQKIKSLEIQLANSENIVAIQNEILEQSKVQLDNGVISSNDHVIQLNASINARQLLQFQKIQLQQTIINYLTLTGQL